MVKKLKSLKTFYLLIENYSGRRTIRKQRGTSQKDAEKRYYHSAAHFRTEGTVLATSKKKSVLKKKREKMK